MDCFAMMMAIALPMATIHGGRIGDIDIASRRPVIHALPSNAVTGWCMAFCQMYSAATAAMMPTAMLMSAGTPKW